MENNNNKSPLMTFAGLELAIWKFWIAQGVALILGLVSAHFLSAVHVKAMYRYYFNLVCGILMAFYVYGYSAIFLLLFTIACYKCTLEASKETVHKTILAIAMAFLSVVHLLHQFTELGPVTISITGPLMVATMKATSLAFEIHDSLKQVPVENEHFDDPAKVKTIIDTVPSLLAYCSYILTYQTVCVGPFLLFSEYQDHIVGKTLWHAQRPKTFPIVFKKLAISLLCGGMHIVLTRLLPTDRLSEPTFLKAAIPVKLGYLGHISIVERLKYYHVWLLAEAVCNSSTLGYQRVHDPKQRWKMLTNINIMEFEQAANIRDCIKTWNLGAIRWLKFISFDRLPNQNVLWTFLMYTVWHGFYPGYYITFANGALFTFAAWSMQQMLGGYILSSERYQLIYKILAGILTRLTLPYIVFPFVLRDLDCILNVYSQLNYCFHFLAISAIAFFAIYNLIVRLNKKLKQI